MALSRRAFIKQSLSLSSGALLMACSKKRDSILKYDTSDNILNESFNRKLSLQGPSILFIGDSITDAGRNKDILEPNQTEGLGEGFVKAISADVLSNIKYKNLLFYNRGVSGNTTNDLLKRWEGDCISLKPSIVNILIGINDLRYGFSPIQFYNNYWNILFLTKSKLPQTKVVICEPFLLPNIANYTSLQSNFTEYRKAVRSLVKEYQAVFIPYYQDFLNASKNTPPGKLLKDGFHPSDDGISLLATSWQQFIQ